jgi:parallel beta-helix repeat protein
MNGRHAPDCGRRRIATVANLTLGTANGPVRQPESTSALWRGGGPNICPGPVAAGISVSGNTIDNVSNGPGIMLETSGALGGPRITADNSTVANNILRNTMGGIITVGGAPISGVSITGNNVTQSNGLQGQGIGVESMSNSVIGGNIVSGAGWYGIYVLSGNNLRISGNIVTDSGQSQSCPPHPQPCAPTWDGIYVPNGAGNVLIGITPLVFTSATASWTTRPAMTCSEMRSWEMGPVASTFRARRFSSE